MVRLVPTYITETVCDINLEDLKNQGIEGLLFDLDNTVMAPKTGIISEDVQNWLDEARNHFKIAILSNNKESNYLKQAEGVLKCPVYGNAQKPRRAAALRALRDLNLEAGKTVMVGDRPLTDILVGQRLGFTTILVDPIMKKHEIAVVKFLRWLERLTVKEPLKTFN